MTETDDFSDGPLRDWGVILISVGVETQGVVGMDATSIPRVPLNDITSKSSNLVWVAIKGSLKGLTCWTGKQYPLLTTYSLCYSPALRGGSMAVKGSKPGTPYSLPLLFQVRTEQVSSCPSTARTLHRYRGHGWGQTSLTTDHLA